MCHRRSLSTLSKAYLRSTKAMNVGDLFNFLVLILQKRWSRQERLGLKPFYSSDRMQFVSHQSESSIENFAKDFEDNTLECNAMVIRICGIGFQDGVD